MRMFFAAISVVAVALLGAALPAHAQSGSQKTPAALAAETNILWPDNAVGSITPYDARQTLLDIIASYPAGPSTSTIGCAAPWANTTGTLLGNNCTISISGAVATLTGELLAPVNGANPLILPTQWSGNAINTSIALGGTYAINGTSTGLQPLSSWLDQSGSQHGYAGFFQARATGASSAVWAIQGVAYAMVSGAQAVGGEIDFGTTATGASATGWALNAAGTTGSNSVAALRISSLGAGATMADGIIFVEYDSIGIFTGALLATQGAAAPTSLIDFSSATPGTNDILMPDFDVDKSGNITLATWKGNVVGLAYGGTNANLTAASQGIVYSTASALAISTGLTAGQVLAGGSSTPAPHNLFTNTNDISGGGSILITAGGGTGSGSIFATAFVGMEFNSLSGSSAGFVWELQGTQVIQIDNSGNLAPVSAFTGSLNLGGASNIWAKVYSNGYYAGSTKGVTCSGALTVVSSITIADGIIIAATGTGGTCS